MWKLSLSDEADSLMKKTALLNRTAGIARMDAAAPDRTEARIADMDMRAIPVMSGMTRMFV